MKPIFDAVLIFIERKSRAPAEDKPSNRDHFKMRIAIVHENWGAGAARCAHDLRRELGTRHVISYFPRSMEDDAERIEKGLSEFRPDIVHCHSFYGGLPYAFLSSVSNRYRTCFTVHDPRPIGTMDIACWSCEENQTCRRCPLEYTLWRQYLRNRHHAQRKIKRRVHNNCPDGMQIVTPSQWMARRLEASELNRFSIRHIPNGIDLDHFKPAPGGREEYGLPYDRPLILFSAWFELARNVSTRKGLADLAEAFTATILRAMPDAILAVAGESFVPNHPSVRPLGLVSYDRLPQLLSAADVYVLPTLADNFPYTVLEAMACGIPVVASEVGGIPEQIVHDETGFLVPPGQPPALGAAILKMLSDPDRAKAMGTEGRKRAEMLFSMSEFGNGYERLFSEMLKTHV